MALCFFLAFERKYWIQCSKLDSLSVVARSSFTVLINDALDLWNVISFFWTFYFPKYINGNFTVFATILSSDNQGFCRCLLNTSFFLVPVCKLQYHLLNYTYSAHFCDLSYVENQILEDFLYVSAGCANFGCWL